MKLWIIIPAWNEEGQIIPLFEELHRFCSRLTVPWEVILVNDGSTDGTVEEARRMSGHLPVRIVDHSSNRGVGHAFRTGFNAVMAEANPGDKIVTMEANKNADPLLIPRMLFLADQGTDLVLASCYAPGGAVVGDPFIRLLMSRTINGLMRLIFPFQGIHTYTSFYRLWSWELVRAVGERTNGRYFNQDGFACMTDMLLKARCIPRVAIREIPMILKSDIRDSGSKMKVGRTVIGYLKVTISNLFA